MANLQDVIQQLKAYGNVDPTHNQNSQNALQKRLAQMAMANNSDWQTMAGLALGNLIRGGFDSWKENYDERGRLKTEELFNNPEWNAPNAQKTYDPANLIGGILGSVDTSDIANIFDAWRRR